MNEMLELFFVPLLVMLAAMLVLLVAFTLYERWLRWQTAKKKLEETTE